ncbi:MAG: hypothetical protein KJP00_02470 [Bacteroidia bacterium]|nr:hypothetical protein [Bacteroidia bacterium]
MTFRMLLVLALVVFFGIVALYRFLNRNTEGDYRQDDDYLDLDDNRATEYRDADAPNEDEFV